MTKRKRRRPPKTRLHRPGRVTVGAEPGYVAPPSADAPTGETTLRVFGYGEGGVDADTLNTVEELGDWLGGHSRVWLQVVGFGNTTLMEQLATTIGMHRLALEDVLNGHQISKTEHYDGSIFCVTRVPGDEPSTTRQLSLHMRPGLLVSFQQRPELSAVALVQDRLEARRPRLLRSDSDYLAYALLDAAVDTFFPLVDNLGDELEALETQLATNPRSDMTGARRIRHRLRNLARTLMPMREAVGHLEHDEGELIAANTQIYLRDCKDHLTRLLSLLDNYRDFSRELSDAHVTALAQHTAEVSKVLTIIATIFIPLSFVAGLYGMNFSGESPYNMPELKWRYGYFWAWGVMVTIALGLIIFFQRRGWLGRTNDPAPPGDPSA